MTYKGKYDPFTSFGFEEEIDTEITGRTPASETDPLMFDMESGNSNNNNNNNNNIPKPDPDTTKKGKWDEFTYKLKDNFDKLRTLVGGHKSSGKEEVLVDTSDTMSKTQAIEELNNKILNGMYTQSDIPEYYYLVDYMFDETHKEAVSCVMADNFKYKIGELIIIPNFDGDMTRVCVPGIHYYNRQSEAMSWHGLINLTPDQINGVMRLEEILPTFV